MSDASASTATTTTPNTALDAGSMIVTGYPGRRLQRVRGQRLPTYQAIMQQHVLDEIHAHGQSSRDAEVCGVLVGNVYRDLWGLFLLVESSIRGDSADAKATQVTFKAETWTHIHDVMERDHPHQKIVGWYHTHPGFGIFLSGMDLFIHDNFFNFPWQIAFVYDPLGGDEGSFVWRAGKPEREEFLIQDTSGAPMNGDELDQADVGSSLGIVPRPRGVGRATWAVGALGLAVCLVAAYYVLSGRFEGPSPAAPTSPVAGHVGGR